MKVAVLVSGGVDSSVALALLARDPSLELTAFYLRIWLEDELAFLGDCPWEEDLRHARAITASLGVPLEVVSLQTAYHERVVGHAIEELARGRTPSPDLHCNERVKFGAFMDAVGNDFDRVATGHYARVEHGDGPSRLFRAKDPVKDQTYFLSRLSPNQLSRSLFPLAQLEKPEVRALASEFGLMTAQRKDSQGICFLGKIPYPAFVREHLGEAPGDIVDLDTGHTLGRHRGLWFHTIGQRQGLGLGGGPWYVVGKDLPSRTLLVAHGDRLALHRRADFEVESLHWFSPDEIRDADLSVKLRHGPRLASCALEVSRDTGRVTLESPEAGIAPGQFAVFYLGEECLGSGIIR